jgi:hypothetical protein
MGHLPPSLEKTGRPTAPSHKKQNSSKKTQHQTSGNAGKFTVGSEHDEGQDDEWTEESVPPSHQVELDRALDLLEENHPHQMSCLLQGSDHYTDFAM